MIGELVRHIRTTPLRESCKGIWASWKHGWVVLLTFWLAFWAIGTLTGIIWFALNAVPIFLIEGWTFERAFEVFKWAQILWWPLAFSLGVRYSPDAPEPAKPLIG